MVSQLYYTGRSIRGVRLQCGWTWVDPLAEIEITYIDPLRSSRTFVSKVFEGEQTRATGRSGCVSTGGLWQVTREFLLKRPKCWWQHVAAMALENDATMPENKKFNAVRVERTNMLLYDV